MGSGNWSDPATWPSGQVPSAGDQVIIESNMRVVLDVSPPALRSLTIDGTLSFAEADLELTTEWILVHGEMHIGSEQNPFQHAATVTLSDDFPDESIGVMGDRGIMVMGGELHLHGSRTHTWTKLSQTANAGSSRIEVLNADGWQLGDEVVLASTDFAPEQTEKRVISGIDGNSVEFSSPLNFMHFGEVTEGVDERGEVGLLTRNIRIQASADAESSYFGGHVAVMAPGGLYISGVEFYRMGQHLKLGRYPVHWHVRGDADGQYVKNSSVHHSFNRCVTVHGTQNVLVENNVTYNTVGHCFFLEDGAETGNSFIHNLGMRTKCHPTRSCQPFFQQASDVLIPSDNNAATFWITNPDNIYRDNVAAGAEEIGFWIALPEHPTGAFEGTEEGAAIWPRRTNIREFSGNVAHSNYDGLMFDRGPNPDGTFDIPGNDHTAYENPADTNSARLTTRLENFTAYKNNNNGVWARGSNHEFSDFKLADNAIGFTHASGSSLLIDSLIVGESDNIGNPSRQAERDYGRSLPHYRADYPIHGYEYYDFTNGFSNVTFRNFQSNTTRDAGAISYLFFSDFGISTNNSAEAAVFDNAKPVFFPNMRSEWALEDSGKDGYKGAIFHDKDGSVGGIADAFIVINNPVFLDAAACTVYSEWNAAVCSGNYGRIGFNNNYFGGNSSEDPGLITLSRNGAELTVSGASFGGLSGKETTLRFGTEITVTTENTVNTLTISLREGSQNDWVILQLPSFTSASTGTEAASLTALRESASNAFYLDADTLYVKLFAGNGFFSGSVNLCTAATCN